MLKLGQMMILTVPPSEPDGPGSPSFPFFPCMKKKMKIENVDFIPDQSIVKLPTLSEGAVTAP